MDLFHQTLHRYRLTGFYMSLPFEEKSMFYHYSNILDLYLEEDKQRCSCPNYPSKTTGKENPARFLWTTAANAIPHRDFAFAEKLLVYALTFTQEQEELAWIHLNLTQLYLDRQDEDKEAAVKGTLHCQETIKSGYFSGWAKQLMEQFH